MTELSGLPGSEGYADCDDAESEGFLFVATKRNLSGVPGGYQPTKSNLGKGKPLWVQRLGRE